VADNLSSPEVTALIGELDACRWTGRKGYGNDVLIGACLVKALYALPTWTWTVALLKEHEALRDAIGGAPSLSACYRFCKKLRTVPAASAALQTCIEQLLLDIQLELLRGGVQVGTNIAIDATDVPAYGNGQRWLHHHGPARERFSDPDASWGHRSAISTRPAGGYYGYKLHLVVCVDTNLPLAWQVATGAQQEGPKAMALIDLAMSRGFAPETTTMDKGYDHEGIHNGCMDRGILPIIPLRMTSDLPMWEGPECAHGLWKHAGRDVKNRRTKWRCPTEECTPASTWRKGTRRTPLVSRESREFRRRLKGRVAAEREFARLKGHYGLMVVRVRGLDRVELHVDLTMLARLSSYLTQLRAADAVAA